MLEARAERVSRRRQWRKARPVLHPVFHPVLPPAQIARIARGHHLPPELIPVDIVMQRWALAIGDGLPRETWDDRPRVRMVPLNDEQAILVDRIVLSAPPTVREIVQPWYKSPLGVRELSRELGVSRLIVIGRWRRCLEWLRQPLERAGVIGR